VRAAQLPLLLGLVAVLGLAACGGSKHASTSASASSASGCKKVARSKQKPNGGRHAPKTLLDSRRTYLAVIETNCGSFTIKLWTKISPRTTASFVSLARSGFFDRTTFHRVVPGFVIQGGDPTGTGSGGPGYSTVDVPPAGTGYTKGVAAMAKTETEPAGTAGSQFFVVSGVDAALPPEYALLGKVSGGMDTVERIGRLGNATTEEPKQPVVIDHVSIQTG
jgi:cyclophilin family peptidyl-prolyl cis-trans isomerase